MRNAAIVIIVLNLIVVMNAMRSDYIIANINKTVPIEKITVLNTGTLEGKYVQSIQLWNYGIKHKDIEASRLGFSQMLDIKKHCQNYRELNKILKGIEK